MNPFMSLTTLLCFSLIRYSNSTVFDISFYYPLSLGSDNLLKQGVTKSRIQCHLDCLRTVECDTIAHRHRSACLLYAKEVLIPGTGASVADYTHSRSENKFAVYSKSKPRCTEWQTHTNKKSIEIQRLCVNLRGYQGVCNPFCHQIWMYAEGNTTKSSYKESKQACKQNEMRLPKNLAMLMRSEVMELFTSENFFIDFIRVPGTENYKKQGGEQILKPGDELWGESEPHSNPDEGCVVANDNWLYNVKCAREMPVVCEKSSVVPVKNAH